MTPARLGVTLAIVGSTAQVYDRWFRLPFVGFALCAGVFVLSWVTGKWDLLGTDLYTFVVLLLLAFTAPVHVRVDERRVDVHYALRAVHIPRDDAVVTHLGRQWFGMRRPGWYLIDRRSSWHRYPLSSSVSQRFPGLDHLRAAGYDFREGEPETWHARA